MNQRLLSLSVPLRHEVTSAPKADRKSANGRAIVEILRRILFQTIPYGKPASRLLDIDAARGLAIVLVVMGHVATASKWPADNDWYLVLMVVIYRFHMPLFMVLTGITFALSLPRFNSWTEVRAFSIKRAKRLFLPYVGLGLVIWLGKLIASRFMYVDNPPTTFVENAITLLLVPAEGVARFLWFVYVLSIYLILVPAFFYAFGRRPVLLFAIGIVLQLGNWPEILMLSSVVFYLPFFAGGMILWTYHSSWASMRPLVFWTSALVFGSLLALAIPFSIPKWLIGACSVPAVIGLMQRVPSVLQLFFGWLGQNSLSIYLLNGIAMGVTKGFLFKFLPWDGVNFLFYFPLLVLAGVAIPLMIKRGAIQWLPPSVAKYI